MTDVAALAGCHDPLEPHHRRRRSGSATAESALASLCEIYWFPVYAFIRRPARSRRCQDLTQAFFTRVLEKGYFKRPNESGDGFARFC
jgi:RNA polymerase sigma-70 factor (ECF subfamily)